MTINEYCDVVDLTEQRARQHMKKGGILIRGVDYIAEVDDNLKTKITVNEEAIKTYQIYKQNCRKRK